MIDGNAEQRLIDEFKATYGVELPAVREHDQRTGFRAGWRACEDAQRISQREAAKKARQVSDLVLKQGEEQA